MATEIISRAEARARGLTKYFTGKPCKNSHIAERRVANGVCDGCYLEIERRSRERNREKYRQKWKRASAKQRIDCPDAVKRKHDKWLAANIDKKKAQIKRWRQANPDKLRLQEQRQREANPEKFRIKNRRYKTENSERLAPSNRARAKQWRKDNPDGVRRISNARRARKRNAEGFHTVEQLEALLVAQDHMCIGCGLDLSNPRVRTIDHIIPLSRGGSQWASNLQWLCKPCNSRKHDKTQLEWLCETAKWLVNNIHNIPKQPTNKYRVSLEELCRL